MKITELLLKEKGYNAYSAAFRIDNPAYVQSWQKVFYDRGNKYYIDIDQFDFTKVPQYKIPYDKAFGAHAQFITEEDETFNIEYFINKDTDLIDVELFFRKVFDVMDCKSE
ncbi:hypothetical protein [Paenibacillus tianjinensis]|uniref:Uncharacterized protein n=1 Tax=Paenibacillus tianjinensis TaxID=2810347 RepID=A0ABX7L8X6_9BACL|nr:hypothetical protein [Paenibacillus tianjinensis]QSF43489.1 hypothetical protein JRJ22_19690 [Paenibacillus tianjinensis]